MAERGATGPTAASRARQGWAVLRVDGPRWAQVVADAALGLTLLSLALGGWGDVVVLALFALVLLGQVVVRLAPLRPAVQAATAAALLAAAWAATFDAYQRWSWLDMVAHFAVTALLAAIATAAVLRWRWLLIAPDGGARARVGTALLTGALGTTLAVVWEFGEWFGHTFLDSSIQVGYHDTIGDLAAGALGALVAGLLLDRLITSGEDR